LQEGFDAKDLMAKGETMYNNIGEDWTTLSKHVVIKAVENSADSKFVALSV